MTFKDNLLRARSYLITIAALVLAFGTVLWIESRRELWAPPTPVAAEPVAASPAFERSEDLAPVRAPRPLDAREQAWAQIAWDYFRNNVDARTGLAASVENYPSTTLWDTGSYLMAVISAQRLGLVGAREFDRRIALALASLQKLPLFDARLPNKAYDIRTLQMSDYANQPSPRGIGWSAIDIGRLLVPLHLLAWQHPQHAAAARGVLVRWDLQAALADGELFGARVDGANRTERVQEGRLGYEQYAARAFALLGQDVSVAGDYLHQLGWVEVEGVRVAHDRRTRQDSGASGYVLSEPYVLDGLEFGWDRFSHELAWRVFLAQQRRFEHTGTLTAVSEDHLDRPPHFAYGTVHADGRDWHTLSDTGEDLSALRTLSVKAAFGWHALLDTEHTRRLVDAVAPLHLPGRGWYAGRYEATGEPNAVLTANTNAVVLESLAFMRHGRFMRLRPAETGEQ